MVCDNAIRKKVVKNLICFFIAIVFGCGSAHSMNFQDAFDFSSESMELIHKCAVDVNKSESSTDLQSLGETEGKYRDFDEFVVFSFPREVFVASVEEVAKFVREKFSNRSLVFTGYHRGANYAAKIVNSPGSSPNFGRNQIKLITFCPADRISESFGRLNLVNRLSFSHAFEKVDFCGSNMVEIPIFKAAELKSRINFGDVAVQCAGWGLLGLSWVSDFHPTLSFVSGIGLIGTDIYMIARRKLQYLPVSGIAEAYRRAVYRSWSAESESELKTVGRYSFF